MRQLLIICIIVTCFVAPVVADDAIFVGLFARHLDYRSELNENNQTIGVKYKNYFASTFVNSEYERSYFFGYMFDTEKKALGKELYLKGNLYVGAGYGYDIDFNVGGWYPAILPTLELGIDRWAMEFLYWPSDGGVISALLNYKF